MPNCFVRVDWMFHIFEWNYEFFFKNAMNTTFFFFIWSGDARLFCRSQWDVSHMRESGVRGGVNLVQWPRVSLPTRGTLQVRIQFVRQWRDPTLEQRNKHWICKKNAMNTTFFFLHLVGWCQTVLSESMGCFSYEGEWCSRWCKSSSKFILPFSCLQ